MAIATLVFGSAAPSGGDERPHFPLAKYPGFGHNPEADEARFDKEERQRESLIAKCMEEEGFFYRASPSVRVDDDGPSVEALAARLSEDANFKFFTGLPGPEREQYNLALAGVKDPETEYLDGGGCVGKAHRTIPGVYAAAAKLQGDLKKLEDDVVNDPSVRAATGKWAECMKAGGHSFSEPQELYMWLDDQMGQGLTQDKLPATQALADSALRLGGQCEASSGLKKAKIESAVRYEQLFVEKHKNILEKQL